MSSEMRKYVAALRDREHRFHGMGGHYVAEVIRGELEDILARTEAGADGRIDHHKAMQALEDLDDCARMDVGIAATGPYDLLRRYIMQQNRTRPQDASGDAVALQDLMTTVRAVAFSGDYGISDEAISALSDALDDAMQAKEAK